MSALTHPDYPKESRARNRTAFHAACEGGHVQIMEWLVSKSKEVIDAKDDSGWTGLFVAAYMGHLPAVEWNIGEKKRLLRDKDSYGANVLHIACLRGDNLEMVAFLLRQRAQLLYEVNNKGETPIFYACRVGSVDIVHFLIAFDPSILEQVTPTKGSPWHAARECSQIETLKYISSIRKDLLEEYGEQLFTLSITDGALPVIQWLVTLQPELLETIDRDSWTVLHAACLYGHLDCVKFILEVKPDLLMRRSNELMTCLHVAAVRGQVTVAQYLIQLNRSLIMSEDKGGWTVLHAACQEGHQDMVAYLLEQEEGRRLLGKRTWTGFTPLHSACARGQVQVVRYVIEHVDVAMGEKMLDAKDKCGRTLLHAACREGHAVVAAFLLTVRPSLLTIRAKDGTTARQMAHSFHHDSLVGWLMSKEEDCLAETIEDIIINGYK
jgi:ankyrin repeat protein